MIFIHKANPVPQPPKPQRNHETLNKDALSLIYSSLQSPTVTEAKQESWCPHGEKEIEIQGICNACVMSSYQI
jgi:hypothetical protein